MKERGGHIDIYMHIDNPRQQLLYKHEAVYKHKLNMALRALTRHDQQVPNTAQHGVGRHEAAQHDTTNNFPTRPNTDFPNTIRA